MTLRLTKENNEEEFSIKSHFTNDHTKPSIQIMQDDKEVFISVNGFLHGVIYVLNNTDLLGGDVRLEFIELVRNYKIVKGWDEKNNKISLSLEYVK